MWKKNQINSNVECQLYSRTAKEKVLYVFGYNKLVLIEMNVLCDMKEEEEEEGKSQRRKEKKWNLMIL